MRPYDEGSEDEREAFDIAFSRRMMQNALMHRVDQGLDAFHIYGFQALGLLDDVSAPEVPDNFCAALLDPNHAARVSAPAGPIVFLREESSVAAVDVSSMLLHPNCEARSAVVNFLETGSRDPNPWLTPFTTSLIKQRSSDVCSDDISRWRTAGLELTPVIQNDLFLHFAGLQQSFVGHYDDGINQHLPRVMQPGFDSLAHLNPPLWSPTEQIEEIRTWIAEFAAYDCLVLALSDYMKRCGYIPLASELSAAEVARQWFAGHPDEQPNWDTLWGWAESIGTPLARYHVVMIALHVPDARPTGSMDHLWMAIADVLDVTERHEKKSGTMCVWQLYCELAAHYLRHIEALHPGQHGERVACYAWWLATKAGRLLGPSERQAKIALDRIVRPEADLSFSRWLIARSPVVPSVFRYCSQYMSSVWAMSLLAQLSLARQSLALEELPPDISGTIGTVLRGYLLASPLANKVSAPFVFAFQENDQIASLCGDVLPEGERDAFVQLAECRNSITTSSELIPRLERLGEDPPFEQNLTVLFAKDAAFCGAEFDEAFGVWLERADEASRDLQKVEPFILEPLLDLLAEFHQRQHACWTIRLPHILSYAIEQSDDEARVKRLFLSTLFMSVNGGVASPIERVLSSKWRSSVNSVLKTWRENAVTVAACSEPWVAGRARATFAVISRLIGPRTATEVVSDDDS